MAGAFVAAFLAVARLAGAASGSAAADAAFAGVRLAAFFAGAAPSCVDSADAARAEAALAVLLPTVVLVGLGADLAAPIGVGATGSCSSAGAPVRAALARSTEARSAAMRSIAPDGASSTSGGAMIS